MTEYNDAALGHFRGRTVGKHSAQVQPSQRVMDNYNAAFQESMEPTRHVRAVVQRTPNARSLRVQNRQRFISRGDDDYDPNPNVR